MLDDGAPRQVVVEVLSHIERGLDVESDAGDEAEGAEGDDRAVEVGILARQPHQLTRAVEKFDRRDRGREVAVAIAGAVGAGGDRARHGDVGQ